MIATWIIVIAAVLGILFIAKLSHLKHKFSMIFLVLFVLLLYLSFAKVASIHSVDLGSVSGFASGMKVYLSWIGNAFDNMRVITGNAARVDWFSNSTR